MRAGIWVYICRKYPLLYYNFFTVTFPFIRFAHGILWPLHCWVNAYRHFKFSTEFSFLVNCGSCHTHTHTEKHKRPETSAEFTSKLQPKPSFWYPILLSKNMTCWASNLPPFIRQLYCTATQLNWVEKKIVRVHLRIHSFAKNTCQVLLYILGKDEVWVNNFGMIGDYTIYLKKLATNGIKSSISHCNQ